MVTVQKNVAQRLFGRTVVDSLDLNQNAWYIDEEQVTVTAAQINAIAGLIPVSTPVDVANDEILFLDHSGGHVGAYDSFADLATAMAGTDVTATAGVFSVNRTTLAAAQAGNGLNASVGVLATSNIGKVAKGGVFFAGKGDCTSVTVGAATYTVGAGGAGTGEWAVGANATESATNLAAAINADTRNGGTNYFNALLSGDGVIIYGKGVGTAYNAAVARVGGAQPATAQALVGGVAEIPARTTIVQYTVTAFDCLLAGFDVVLPFVPTTFIAQARSATGLIRDGVITDLLEIQATPNRVHVTFAGATHLIAGDTLTVIAQE
jgi:hypothetical protein